MNTDIYRYIQQIQDLNVISAFQVLINTLADKQDKIVDCLEDHQRVLILHADSILKLESKVSNLSDKTIYGEYVD